MRKRRREICAYAMAEKGAPIAQRNGILPRLDISCDQGCVTLSVNKDGFDALKAVINRAEQCVAADGELKERRISTARYITRSGEFRLELICAF